MSWKLVVDIRREILLHSLAKGVPSVTEIYEKLFFLEASEESGVIVEYPSPRNWEGCGYGEDLYLQFGPLYSSSEESLTLEVVKERLKQFLFAAELSPEYSWEIWTECPQIAKRLGKYKQDGDRYYFYSVPAKEIWEVLTQEDFIWEPLDN